MKELHITLILCFASFASMANYITAQTEANQYIAAMKYRHDPVRNIITDNNRTIHIFLYEDGNLLVGGYPTTATERDKFQVHLYVESTNSDEYLLEYTGTYSPSLNIQSKNALVFVGVGIPPPPVPMHFAVLGPFTGNLQITVKHQTPTGSYNAIASTTIVIAKTVHVSIGSGLIYSSLKNPDNIKKVPINGSTDSTLIADDVHGRGMLTIMATFYPGGRSNLFIPSKAFKDHFGITVGTAIAAGSSNFKDLFLGIQYDFAAGGSVVSGLHYGRRQMINDIDYKEFEFGETKFTGKLEDKLYKDWSPGFYIGVQVDSRIFSQLFK
jgi:hypothetical protein